MQLDRTGRNFASSGFFWNGIAAAKTSVTLKLGKESAEEGSIRAHHQDKIVCCF
jgi:hypothetical protein